MSDLSQTIARQLPYLRRYARAISGSQKHGDRCVKRCLEALLEDGVDRDLDATALRLLMYRSLHDVWIEPSAEAREVQEIEPALANDSIVASRIEQLAPRKRQILVLTTLEGFALPQAASILRLQPEVASALLDQARADLHAQEATRILIIEDEPVIALDIENIVRQDGHTVVGIATTHIEAVTLARREGPGLVLADIQLADDSSGLDAVREILEQHAVPVIFITAFPERLLTGERPEPTFLITKPFDPDTLRVSISQALATTKAVAPA
jgi:CheY-like chemotaxis protein/DNA-directed RNA polymerase specialized sigma24 family protein